jgi:hypothetical protein
MLALELDQPGLYLEDGLVKQDFLEDFESFYGPLKQALILRMQAGASADSSCNNGERILSTTTQAEPDGKD